ncbi:MAG: hypothetical protein ACP5K9_03710 [Candidatus Micrarchaeia archaeon]
MQSKKSNGIFDKVCDIFFKPSSITGKKQSIGESLAFYYKASILPLLLFMAFSYIFFYYRPVYSYGIPMMGIINVPFLAVLWAILLVWVAIPISIFVNAFLYQLIGYYFLRLWNGSYEKTFAAVMFGEIPVVSLIWLMPIPIANVIFFIAVLWGFGVLVIALSEQQKITRLRALGAVLLTGFAVALIVVMAFAAMLPHTVPMQGLGWPYQ